MSAPDVSHGRGGAGNITPDDTQYVDGEVVRVGAEGSHGDGAYSTGRGGTKSLPILHLQTRPRHHELAPPSLSPPRQTQTWTMKMPATAGYHNPARPHHATPTWHAKPLPAAIRENR